MRLSALATLVNGQLSGEDTEVLGIRGMEDAGADQITFLANPAYLEKLATCKAGAVLVTKLLPAVAIPQIVVRDAYLAMAIVAQEFAKKAAPAPGIHPSAVIDPAARIAASAYIGPGSVIEAGAVIGDGVILKAQNFIGQNAQIGSGSLLYPGVKVLENCKIGQRNILYSGVVIGSDGFGYAPDAAGHRHKIPQLGIVELGDDVEVGANSTIDRATFGSTRVGNGTKIDNLVMVAHNVQIGQDTVLCSQVGIAGSSTLGDRVICAGQSGINGHISIADDCQIGGQSGVAQSLPAGSKVAGSPALPHIRWIKVSMIFSKLDELIRRLGMLERQLKNSAPQADNMER